MLRPDQPRQGTCSKDAGSGSLAAACILMRAAGSEECEWARCVTEELGGLLQRKFKTSCSITRLPGKVDTGKEIALQGNLLQVRGTCMLQGCCMQTAAFTCAGVCLACCRAAACRPMLLPPK
jgi:hypothetical protein